jgi:hypothetical protein
MTKDELHEVKREENFLRGESRGLYLDFNSRDMIKKANLLKKVIELELIKTQQDLREFEWEHNNFYK